MATATLLPPKMSPLVKPQPALAPLPEAEAPKATAPVPVSWEHQAHLGDWIGFTVWTSCFLLLAAFCVYEFATAFLR